MALLYYPKKLFSTLFIFSSLFGKGDASITKTFHFKEDLFLKFYPLSHAIGPDNVDVLMSALQEYAEHFKDVWVQELETNLQNGSCNVDDMALPEFSICDWRYPDRYDIEELPTPGQSYIHFGNFVQRLFYEITELTVTCEEDFSYSDLDRDVYTEVAFSGDTFLDIINPPGDDCNTDDSSCLFSTTETIEWDTFDASNSELYINRYLDIPVFLKCLDLDGYGPSIANILIEALDNFFELKVSKSLSEAILSQEPEASIYNFASPYTSERQFCAHGSYYTDGNLVNQVSDADGILITKFTYGFDVIWFKPQDFNEDLLPNIESIIHALFEDEEFLFFLQEAYPDYDFIQNSTFCQVIDPSTAEVTMAPTNSPTSKPTIIFDIGEGPCMANSQCATGLVCHDKTSTCVCNVETNDGCAAGNICEVYTSNEIPQCYCNIDDNDSPNGCENGQVCRFSCAFLIAGPKCFDDELVRDCAVLWGKGYTCADGNDDGVINFLDKQSGCIGYPTPSTSPFSSPIPIAITSPPTEEPTTSPTTRSPTIGPSTSLPTTTPTKQPITEEPTFSSNPTIIIEPSAFPTITVFPSIMPTIAPSSEPTYFPTRNPFKEPTTSPTYGNSETVGDGATVSPTVFFHRTIHPASSPIQPAITVSPTTSSPTAIIVSPTSIPTKLIACENSNVCGDGSCCIGGFCQQSCIQDPNDTEEDECPVATTGTCGGGDRGDGHCPFAGYCCSKWGWCGTTAEYCDDDSNVPTPSTIEGAPTAPTYALDAGKCGNGSEGEGTCVESSQCCSSWGYCGTGENYCFTTRVASDFFGTCGGGGVGNGQCLEGQCCSRFGFCGTGDLYCTGTNGLEESDDLSSQAEEAINNSPLPENLKPKFGFRCGITEVDARSNCKPECTHHIQCSAGEECWGIQLNYCHTFEEESHPICTDLDSADNDSRCGFDEMSARGHCGPKCDSDDDCGTGEYCFPTLLNLCECNELTNPEQSSIAFSRAKALISPFFVHGNDVNVKENGGHHPGKGPKNIVEGKPRNDSHTLGTAIIVAILFPFNLWYLLM